MVMSLGWKISQLKMVRYIDMEEQEQEIEKQVSILDGHIEYIPVNVKIRIVSFDKISGSWKRGILFTILF